MPSASTCPPIILASSSPYRREALERLGLDFRCLSPSIDEEAMKDPSLQPQALASHLARAKALSLLPQFPQAIIIGSDQLVDLDGEILGKPNDAKGAQQQLQRMSGRSHRLITAMEVISPEGCFHHCDITTLHMHALTDAGIQRYIERDQPWNCAGSYRIEAAGISLFVAITSKDHSAITGLPILALVSILRKLGHPIP
ncbi:MAG: septum formation protein Maf [Planctomycetota bacterium]|nr:MAG: septum formation protein Maf [Planctomycetota bacterium]